MDDLISRQAAIDAFNTGLNELVVVGKENSKMVENYLNRVIEKIKCLPSVQLATDTNVGTKLSTNLAEVGTDCISREQAIVALGTITVYKGSIPFDTAMMRIEQLPPAQPEIIRCKDCKHWIPYDWMFSEVWRSKNMADYSEDEIGCNYCDMTMKANDFCSRGERRTE